MKHTLEAILCASACFALPSLATAQIPVEEDEIITTGARISQGGAQDINFFRGEVDLGHIPHANTFTSEGLLSQHDLYLTPQSACVQTLCLVAQTMPANFQTDIQTGIQADYFLGLGFDSNISETTWEREPINLVAVIDKSGSMSGAPLEMAKRGLHAALTHMKEGDQLSIILYGAEVHAHFPPTRITAHNKDTIRHAINQIESSGSTYMEAGLALGYETAKTSAQGFDGNTRLMLFTDERPNVGNTDAESFMGMAVQGSHDGIGMTTIGVGIQFGAELATKISSVRGGNLFFARDKADINTMFENGLDFMVSEVAHDLTIAVTPVKGMKITGIYGVPQDTFAWQDSKGIEMRIPTAFMSANGGGIFLTMARENTDLPFKAPQTTFAKMSLSYKGAKDHKTYAQGLDVTPMKASASKALQKAHLLVEEYQVLRTMANAFHQDNNQELAYQTIHAFAQKLQASPLEGMQDELKLVAGLESQLGILSGHGEEIKSAPKYVRIWNRWKITNIEGGIDLHRGDILDFSPDGNLEIFRKSVSLAEPDEEETYSINNKQVHLDDSGLTFDFKVRNSRLTLRHVSDDLTITLRAVKPTATQGTPALR